MTKPIKSLLSILILIVVSQSALLATFTVPTGYSYLSRQQHPTELNFFMQYAKVDASNNQVGSLFKVISFDADMSTYQNTVELSKATTTMQKKAVSFSLNCAILFTPSTSKTQLYKFDLINPTGPFADISSLVTGATSLQVGDMCSSFRKTVGGVATTYHWNPTANPPAFQNDNPLPAWTNPVYTNDMNFVAADDGIYTYTSKTYAKTVPLTLYQSKKIFKSELNDKLVFFSNDLSGNYKTIAFKVSGNTLSLILNATGQTASTPAPKISLSRSLQTIMVYGQSFTTSGTSFYDLNVIDYSNSRFSSIMVPPTTAKNYFTDVLVTDQYLYAKNPTSYAAFYFLTPPGAPIFLKLYNEAPKSTDQTNVNWARSIIYNSAQQVLSLYHFSYTNAAGANGQLAFSTLDSKPSANRLFWIDGTNAGLWKQVSMPESKLRLGWFSEAKQSTNKAFRMSFYDGTLKQSNAFTLASGYTMKGLSAKQTCAILSDGSLTRVYQFTENVAPLLFATITTLLTGVSSPIFELSDDCKGLKINSLVYHWNAGTSAYDTDTLPSWVNPTFSNDFTYAVGENGIYKYTERVGATSGFYTLDKADTFLGVKNILRLGNNLLVSTYNPIPYSGNSDYKVQVYVIGISTPSLLKVDQTIGVARDLPNIVYSSSLSNIVIYGLNGDGIPFVIAKTMDFAGLKSTQILLPPEITSTQNYFTVSDSYLYVRNKFSNPITNIISHMGYSIQNSMLARVFQEAIVDQLLINNYYRSFLVTGLSGTMTLAHEYFAGGLIRYEKEEKSTSNTTQTVRQSADSMKMTFLTDEFPTIVTQETAVGKWLYTSSTGTKVGYLRYDPAGTNNYNSIQSATLTGNNFIKATSQNFDCLMTYVSGSALRIYSVDNSSITQVQNMYSALLADGFTSASLDALTAKDFQVGNSCWAFRVAQKIYINKFTTSPKFLKDTTASAWTNAVYDKSVKFAFAANKIYKWNESTNTYALIFTSLKTHKITKRLYVNKDQNVSVIFSYQPGAPNDSLTPFTYQVQYIKASLNSSTWDSLGLQFPGTTGNGVPKILFTPQLDIIGMKYINDINQPQVSLKKIIGSAIPSPIQVPSAIINSPLPNDRFTFSQNYMYFANTQEILFQIDRVNLKLIEVFRRALLLTDTANLVKAMPTQSSSNSTTIFYEYITPLDMSVSVRKRQLGTPAIQQVLTNIDQSTTGLVVMNDQPVVCSSGCKVCFNPERCQTCLDGFALMTDLCIKCTSPCKNCLTGTPASCIDCFDGFYLSGTICTRCNQTCLTCSAGTPTSCTSCKMGSFLSSGACATCMENCISCTNSTVCVSCRIGYVFSRVVGSCIKCMAGCTNCNQTRMCQCNQCFEGFQPIYNNRSQIIACKSCPINCKNCTNGTCTQCKLSFRLLSGKCYEPCRIPCKQCATDPTKCTSCIGSYTFNASNQACDADLSCNTGSTCTSCPLGYVLLMQYCYICQGGANCSVCDSSNPNVCVGCVRGYFLNSSSLCQTCAEGCGLCDNGVYCRQCLAGYTLSGNISQSTCLKCNVECATCSKTVSNCDTCATGYNKIGWKCVSNKKVKFVLKLNTVFENFETVSYMMIERDICGKTKKPSEKITVTSIVAGSVDIEGQIDSNDEEMNEIVDLMAVNFGQGSTIGGFEIMRSSYEAIVDDQVVYTSGGGSPVAQNNTIIIAPIVVVTVVVIIAITLYILYKKGIIFGSAVVESMEVHDMPSFDGVNNNISTLNDLKSLTAF